MKAPYTGTLSRVEKG